MNVNFDGRTYSFDVKPGPDGYRKFTEAIRRAFALPDDSELNITFTCDEPSAGVRKQDFRFAARWVLEICSAQLPLATRGLDSCQTAACSTKVSLCA